MSIGWTFGAPFICTAASSVLLYFGLRNRDRIAWLWVASAIVLLLISFTSMFILALVDGLAVVVALLLGFYSTIELLIGNAFVLAFVPGWRRLWPALLLIAYPLVMFAVIWSSQPYNITAQTRQKAEPIIDAQETYRTRTGRYPESLEELTPRDLAALPEQRTMWGWLYQASGDEYQLGYVESVDWAGYDVNVYSSRDKERDYKPYFDNPFKDLPPTPTPPWIGPTWTPTT